jgi:putative ABC transport system ATP-binding protein
MSDRPIVQLISATRSYGEGEGMVAALKGVSLTIREGDFLCAAGLSGSGKTTLLNLAGLLDKPTSGEVMMEGIPTSTLSKTARAELRKATISFVFQDANLLPVLTAAENVEFALMLRGVGQPERRARALEALALVGIADKAARLPHKMSGGERQRASIARAVASRPKLVIADEPTASLDGETGLAIVELLARINREEGTAFLLSSHDPKVIGGARTVIRLRDGTMEKVEDGR